MVQRRNAADPDMKEDLTARAPNDQGASLVANVTERINSSQPTNGGGGGGDDDDGGDAVSEVGARRARPALEAADAAAERPRKRLRTVPLRGHNFAPAIVASVATRSELAASFVSLPASS